MDSERNGRTELLKEIIPDRLAFSENPPVEKPGNRILSVGYVWIFYPSNPTNAALWRQLVKLVPALTRTRQTCQGGSGVRERVSEYLEESPRRLARPLPAKSWDVSRLKGVMRNGVSGVQRDSEKERKLPSLCRCAFLAHTC